MQSKLFRHIYSTTLVTTLLASTSIAFPSAHVSAAAEQTTIASLSIDQAVEKALKNNVDLELLRIAAESTYYDSLLTLRDSQAVKEDSIYTLKDAQSKYKEAAKANRDILKDQATMDALKNTLQLQVEQAYLEILSLKEKIKSHKQSIQRHYWYPSANEEAKNALSKLEDSYKQALAKLNGLIWEAPDKEWRLEAYDLVHYQLPAWEEVQATAYEKRPDMIKAEEERKFADVKVKVIAKYSSVSTYQGKIARNDLKKAEILLQRAKSAVDQEVKANYEKVVAATKDWEESKSAKDAAQKQYDQAWSNFLNRKVSLDELIDIEAKLLDSETKATDSLYQYNVAVVTLKQSIGN
ncbi:TolC family protein [Brevibacillus reuszeri]|uniref:TolC family protein n=1 Tax=Brevibacillus reuszeri TaxID=54915 RepID=UPI00366B8846